MDRRGLQFPVCRARLQARLGNFEPVLVGPAEQRRERRSKRDSSVETAQSGTESTARKSVSKEVPPEQVADSATSDTSSVHTPDLLDFKDWGPMSKSEASEQSSTSGSRHSQKEGTMHHKADHMASVAADSMKRKCRRKSAHALRERAKDKDTAAVGSSKQQPPARQMAYCFDGNSDSGQSHIGASRVLTAGDNRQAPETTPPVAHDRVVLSGNPTPPGSAHTGRSGLHTTTCTLVAPVLDDNRSFLTMLNLFLRLNR